MQPDMTASATWMNSKTAFHWGFSINITHFPPVQHGILKSRSNYYNADVIWVYLFYFLISLTYISFFPLFNSMLNSTGFICEHI